jgi:hypothetical protein
MPPDDGPKLRGDVDVYRDADGNWGVTDTSESENSAAHWGTYRTHKDGEIPGGHAAWYLLTALEAMEQRHRQEEVYLDDMFAGELAALNKPGHLQSMTGRDAGALWDGSIPEIADIFEREPETVFHWVKSGCPYLVEGDWQTGAGFVLRWGWCNDWWEPRYAIAMETRQFDVIRKLMLA